MPPVVNLYPNSGKQAKRVEISGADVRESLPKQRIFLIWVEIPDADVRESLPKQRKIGENGRESRFRRLEISTQKAKIGRKW